MTDQETELFYQKALNGLLRMHHLFVEGKRKSDEVKRLRDELDEPFLSITREQNKVLEGLSIDLFDVEKIKESKRGSNSPELEAIVKESIAAREEGRLNDALSLLRKAKGYSPFGRISYLRSNIWHLKGEDQVAAVFAKHALDLDPESEQLQSTYAALATSVNRGVRFSPNYADARNALVRHWMARALWKADEAKEADDEFKEACRHVTFIERERVEGLARDMSVANAAEKDTVPLPAPPEARAEMGIALKARQSGEFDIALGLLRKNEKYFPASQVAYLRGRTWSAFGDKGVAVIFLQHAVRLEPRQVGFHLAFILELFHLNPAAAYAMAVEMLSKPDGVPAGLLVNAANIVFNATRQMDLNDRKLSFMNLSLILERCLVELEAEADKPKRPDQEAMFEDLLFSTESLLASCYEQLGQFHKAYDCYSKSIARRPLDGVLLAARAVLPGGDREKAAQDMEAAIAYGVPYTWPYLFLARYYYQTDRFEECLKICKRALRNKSQRAKRSVSELLEMTAMAQLKCDFPVSVIRAYFEEAIRVDEKNERASKRLSILDDVVKEHQVDEPEEELDDEVEVSELRLDEGVLREQELVEV